MTKQNHIHKLKKHQFKSGNAFFFCTLPDCNFKMNPALSLGKRAICWRCNQSFILNEYSIRLVKPHCEACHKPKSLKDHDQNFIMSETPIMSEADAVAEHSLVEPLMTHKPVTTDSLSERLKGMFTKDEEI